MSHPRTLDAIDHDIAEAWRDLRDARAACDHSLNSDTVAAEAIAQARCNELLDERLTVQIPRQVTRGSRR